MDDDCTVKYIEIVPVEDYSDSPDIKHSAYHIKVERQDVSECTNDVVERQDNINENVSLTYQTRNEDVEDVLQLPVSVHQPHSSSVLCVCGSVEPTDVQNESSAASPTMPFCQPLTDEQLGVIPQSRFPKNTVNSTSWAVTLFGEWRDQRSRRSVEESSANLIYLTKPFALMSDQEINHCVPIFLAEVKKRNGDPYPAATLRHIVLALQKFLAMQGRCVKFLNSVQFRAVRDTLDALMKERTQVGIGMKNRQAQIITEEMENTLWEKGLLGDNSPATLLNTLIYLFGLHFALRGRDEHRQLRHYPSQISIKVSKNGRRYLEYKQDLNKTGSDELETLRRRVKVTQAYELVDSPKRCPVRLYKLYNSLCPSSRPADAFYLRPLKNYNDAEWYESNPVGKNTLCTTVSRLCKAAGFAGFFSNHSLRATAATRVFDAHIDEQPTDIETDHAGDAVRAYKRGGESIQENLTDIVASKSPKAETDTV